ncbi:MAG: DUF5320 domain-containing protein [Nanoarchaeota archaeon]|nr:DUF5320 domain-containing protein [Nanoarchaeota archaeon]
MPFGDGTGPDGRGPMTGRGLGYCAGYNSPGFTRGVPMGRGFGRGFRWRRIVNTQPANTENITSTPASPVVEMINELKKEIDTLKKKIDELK